MTASICHPKSASALLVLSLAACASYPSLNPDETGAAEVPSARQSPSADQSAAVMARLAPPVLIAGRDRPTWTLEERLAHHRVPGVSIAVLEDGVVSWTEASGLSDAAQGTPVKRSTRFQAASVSKPVTALGALILVEEGHLNLDAPVNDYLKRWKLPANRFTERDPITLRHLLSHTGGLTGHGFPGYPAGADLPTSVQVLNGSAPANTSAVLVNQRPGLGFRYSGGGYTILQMMMEDVTEESFPALMERLVLGPAGMTSSSFEQPLAKLAAPFASAGHGPDGASIPGHSHRYPELAAAGLWTTPEDLLKLSIAVSGSAEGRPPLLSKRMMAELKTVPSGGDYGLGFSVSETKGSCVLNHSGANVGFRAMWFFDDSGSHGAAIMTNGDNGQALLSEVQSALADVYGWSFGASEIRAVAELSEADTKRVLGRYVGSIEGAEYELVITAGDGHFVVQSDLGIPPTEAFMYADRSGLFSQDGDSISFLGGDEEFEGFSLAGSEFRKT